MEYRWMFNSPLVCITIATVLWFLVGVVAKLVERDLPVLENVFLRSVFSIPSIIAMGLWSRSPIIGHYRNVPMLFLRGLAGAVVWTTLYGSMMLLPLGDAMALQFTSSAITALAAWLLRLDRNFRWFTSFGVGSSFVGVIFITQPPFLFGGGGAWTVNRKLGLLLGLVCMLHVSAQFLLTRYLAKSEGVISMTFWQLVVTALFCVVPLARGFPQAVVWSIRKSDWGLILLFTAGSLLAQLLNTRGIQLSSATLAATMNSLELVLGRLADMLVFHYSLSGLGTVGTCLMFGGAVTVAAGMKEHKGMNGCARV